MSLLFHLSYFFYISTCILKFLSKKFGFRKLDTGSSLILWSPLLQPPPCWYYLNFYFWVIVDICYLFFGFSCFRNLYFPSENFSQSHLLIFKFVLFCYLCYTLCSLSELYFSYLILLLGSFLFFFICFILLYILKI